MDRKEFDRIVNEAVAAGADRKDAEAYVVDGFKLEGIPAAETVGLKRAPAKPKAAAKK